MELEEQSGIDTWRGAAEGGTFLLWRSSMPAVGRGVFLAAGRNGGCFERGAAEIFRGQSFCLVDFGRLPAA